MAVFDCLVDVTREMGDWKLSTMADGELFAQSSGIHLMERWHVTSWDSVIETSV